MKTPVAVFLLNMSFVLAFSQISFKRLDSNTQTAQYQTEFDILNYLLEFKGNIKLITFMK